MVPGNTSGLDMGLSTVHEPVFVSVRCSSWGDTAPDERCGNGDSYSNKNL